MHIQTVGFIGFGLIGGSIARGLKEKKPDYRLLAYNYYENRPNPRLAQAGQDGILDDICTDMQALKVCDLLFLCAPVCSNISYLSSLKDIIKEDCIVTDVGSVKENIHQAVSKLHLEKNFIGGHPMAGSEKTGYDHSTSDLLKDACYILTPTAQTPETVITYMQDLVQQLGAKPILLDAAHHDAVTAAISHVPHILSSALIHMVKDHAYQDEMCKLAAGAFRDMTRISASSPVMWKDICMSNATSILHFLQLYKEQLATFEKALKEGDETALFEAFSTGKEFRDTLYH